MALTNYDDDLIKDLKYPILFEETYWRLNKVEYYEPPMVWSFISHLCPDRESSGEWRWSIVNEDEVCPGCHQLPSDALITLYKLHNWDRLAGRK